MPEANLTSPEKPEVGYLIRDLEGQIETMNAALAILRNTVSRLAEAAGTTSPPHAPVAESPLAHESVATLAAAAFTAPVTDAPDSATSLDAEEKHRFEEAPVFRPDSPPVVPAAHRDPAASHDDHFGESVADGASWPTARDNMAKPEPQHVPGEVESDEPPAAAKTEEVTAESQDVEADAPAEPIVLSWELPTAESAVASPPETEKPSPSLSRGWPDESAWSQSFEWPAMKPDAKNGNGAGDAHEDDGREDDGREDVSSIVAQVRAELEAARSGGADLQPVDFGDEPLEVDSESITTNGHSQDDQTRRDQVSRAVAEMRAELAGRQEAWDAGDDGDSARRDGVSRAVEQIRAEFAASEDRGGDDGESQEDWTAKPAFPLASPDSALPDWANLSVDIGGPPVIVIKDAEGRVELASVFETLNAIDCNQSAALLNYTPHSVTIGVPARASLPSHDKIAAVVTKIFGRKCRVDSDGVRTTVTIGDGGKPTKNEDAA